MQAIFELYEGNLSKILSRQQRPIELGNSRSSSWACLNPRKERAQTQLTAEAAETIAV